MTKEEKVVAVVSTDWHLKRDNIDETKDLVVQKCKLADELGTDLLICLGDVFDSRKSQELSVLSAFSDILDIVFRENKKMIVVPGNHDKVNYSSIQSFLDPFTYNPSMRLCRDTFLTNELGFPAAFIPFWEESTMEEKLKDVPDGYTVFSHFGTNQSVNNDGTKNESLLTVSSLKRFKKVYLGHFHDTHAPSDNILHIPSIKQNNYGENNKKGFTVITENGESFFVKGKFKEYKTYIFDLDKSPKKDLDLLVSKNTNSPDHIRVEVIGSQSKLKSLKRESFTNSGIDLKTKTKEVTDAIDAAFTDEVVEFSPEKIKEKFKEFCEEKEYSYEEGKFYIDQKI